MCGRRPRPRVRKHQNQGHAALLTGQDQTPCRGEIHVIQLGHHGGQRLVARALLNRSQHVHPVARIDQQHTPRIQTRRSQAASGNPPVLMPERPLTYPQAYTRPIRIAHRRQGQTREGREIPEPRLDQLMQAGLPQPERERRRGGLGDRLKFGFAEHCSVFVP